MENTQRQRAMKEQKMRQNLLQWIGLGRTAILLLLAVSLLNTLLSLFKVDYHFLFSAAVPHYLNWLAGKLAVSSGVTPLKIFAVIVTLLTFASYAACWAYSARRRHFLKIALLLYCVDTLLLVVFAVGCIKNPLNCLLELLVHLIGVGVLYHSHCCAQQLHRMARRKSPRPAPQQPEYDE